MSKNWAYAEFAGCFVLPPIQRVSAARIVGSLTEENDVSFSSAVGHGGRQACWRIARKAGMTPTDLLTGHFQQTAVRCSEYPSVLLVEDTTALDYASHKALRGLGPLNGSDRSKGFFAHSCLAVTEDGLPLGLLSENMWARDPDEKGKSSTRRNRLAQDKESIKWARGMAEAQSHLLPGQNAIVVADREADVFTFFSAPRRSGIDFLIRAAHPRNVTLPDDPRAGKLSLLDAAAQAPVVGHKLVVVHRRANEPERQAVLEVAMTKLSVVPPRNGKRTPETPIALSVVRATETDAPERGERIEWVLVTTLECTTHEDACRVVDLYSRRWVIERFHYTLKSGLNVERLQVDEADALMNTVALLMVAAWRLLYITILARTDPDLPASVALTQPEIQVLTVATKREVNTIAQAVLAIAILAGFVTYRSAPLPGVKMLWLGLRKLTDMTAGYMLATYHTRLAT